MITLVGGDDLPAPSLPNPYFIYTLLNLGLNSG
jgi:hypothetical protein